MKSKPRPTDPQGIYGLHNRSCKCCCVSAEESRKFSFSLNIADIMSHSQASRLKSFLCRFLWFRRENRRFSKNGMYLQLLGCLLELCAGLLFGYALWSAAWMHVEYDTDKLGIQPQPNQSALAVLGGWRHESVR